MGRVASQVITEGDRVRCIERLPVHYVTDVSGATVGAHYDIDGNRSLMGSGDRSVVTPHDIGGGRRIETSLLGDRMSVALFSVEGASSVRG